MDRTREATEAISAIRALKREKIRDTMLDRIQTILDRINEPHIEFVGQSGRRETLPVAPAEATRAYAQAATTLYKDFRTDVGDVATRNDNVSSDDSATTTNVIRFDDAIRSDHERDLLRAAVEREQSLRDAEREAAGKPQ